MYRQSILSFLFITLFSVGLIYGQAVAPVTGTIEIAKGAVKTPIEGAKVDIFREDVKGQAQTIKTTADGKFTFQGLAAGASYILSISAPGASPTYLPGIKPGMQNVLITMEAGDGRSVTEDELKGAIAAAAGQMSAEEKKAFAEKEKLRKEVEERNQRAENNNKVFETALKEGEAAYKANDYTLAVAKFDEGINASPEFEGSAPVFYNYKAVALKNRARGLIVEAQKGDKAARAAAAAKATPDYELALTSYQKGLAVVEKAPADSPAKASLASSKKNLYHNFVVTLGEMYETSIPVPDGVDAAKAVAGYIETEPDVKKRAAVLAGFGDKAMRGGALKASAMAFKKVLESLPADPDALSGAAIAIGGMAFMTLPPDQQMMKEATTLAQQYLKSAPKDHKNMSAVEDIVENIKLETSKKN